MGGYWCRRCNSRCFDGWIRRLLGMLYGASILSLHSDCPDGRMDREHSPLVKKECYERVFECLSCVYALNYTIPMRQYSQNA